MTHILNSGITTSENALQLYDQLEPIGLDFMIGRWIGSELHTGHKMDGLLELTGWYGKLFVDPENVHPLLFYTSDGSGIYAVNPDLIPLTFNFPKVKFLRQIVAVAKPLLQTKKPKAKLRMMEYRGKVSATMVYDSKSIHDHFRLIDENRVMGLMDLKGEPQPYFFILKRDDNQRLKVQLPI